MNQGVLGVVVDSELFRSSRSLLHRGRRTATDERVVIKTLREPQPPPAMVAWARREYELLRSLDGVEGVLKALEFGRVGETVGMALEDIGGMSLAELTREIRLPIEEVLRLMSRVAQTLSMVHAAGIIHKDLNPSNIVYTRATGKFRLIDFGIATHLAVEDTPFDDRRAREGTLAYISPEQTGRMNRPVDHRTDLYAFGATLYELLTGRPPFTAQDPLELMHAHLARVPTPPFEAAPLIPVTVSDIVMRLLAKDADHRYPSADGLAADLLECANRLRDTGHIDPFPLARTGRPSRLALPQRLIGREAEIRTLLDALDRAAAGSAELLVVRGYSGVGKSALVHEVHRPITERRGLWGHGKFDQYQRDVPYASLAHAFRGLVRQLLGQSDSAVARWRAAIGAAVGPNGRLLTDLVPEVIHLIGLQPEVPALPPAEAQRRTEHTVGRFVAALASAEHPLTLFLDDLQWADPASICLLEALMVRGDATHLLVIGAYRDNEVGPGHPLALCLDRLASSDASLRALDIRPLALADVLTFVALSLGEPPAELRPLAALVAAKTQGNPFFMREFLKSLCSEGLLTPGAHWSWNVDAIAARGITDNVVELMAGKLRRLSEDTREVLRVAGAIGGEFDLATLAVVLGWPAALVWTHLWPAVSVGTVVALDEAWKLIGLDVEGLADTLEVRFRFSHDRVQQAAWSLTAPADLPTLHATIGRRLLARMASGTTAADGVDTSADALFAVVGHLNMGRLAPNSLGIDASRLARLNLRAAQRAKASAAFAVAREYALIGLELLGEGAFEAEYSAAMALCTLVVETAYQTGDLALMDQWFAVGVAKSKSVLDSAWMQEIKVESYNSRGLPLEALRHALDYLEQLGIVCPRAPGAEDVGQALGRTAELVAGRTLDDLAAMSDIADPAVRTAVGLICKVYSSAYVASPMVFVVLTLKQVQLVIEHGNCAVSPLAYAVYGLLLAGLVGDVRRGYDFGRLSDRLLGRPDTDRYRAQALHLFSCHTRFWCEHVQKSADGEREAWRVGLETGELEFGSYGGHVAAKYSFFHGHELGTLLAEIEHYTHAMRRSRNDLALSSHLPWHQAVQNLGQRGSSEPWRLAGPVLDAAASHEALLAAGNRMAISNTLLAQLMLAHLFGRYDEAIAYADAGAAYLDAVLSQFNQPVHVFFDALARLAALEGPGSRTAGEPDRDASLARVDDNLGKLRTWAASAPVNFAQKVALIEAERARVTGSDAEARETYDRAIALAEEHSFTLDEALACEAAARFHLAAGRRRLGRHYLRDAQDVYLRWGAVAKAEALEAEFPDLVPAGPSLGTTAVSTSSTWHTPLGGGQLDLASVLKASQAISTEVVLPNLLRRLVTTLMESAGADRVVLLLDRDGELFVEAEGRADGAEFVPLGVPLDRGASLATTAVQYVARTGTAVVIDDALTSAQVSIDPHVIALRPRSLLCQPIFGAGRLRGVVYLENSLAPGVFTAQRTELIALLAGQIATSIDQARLYANLEERVAQRTARLEAQNRFIRHVFGRYMSDDIVDAVLESEHALALGGERRTVTVMFADIRGFTGLCERLTAEQVVQMLNVYFSAVMGVVRRWQGTVDNIIADGVLILFGAPVWREGDPDRAVACAIDMQLAMATVNAQNESLGLPKLAIGIGIHTGEVVVGNIGSSERAKYSVIGSTVNLASRIEAITAGGQVLVSEATLAAVSVPVRVDEVRSFTPKGFDTPINVLRVGAIGGRFDCALPVPPSP